MFVVCLFVVNSIESCATSPGRQLLGVAEREYGRSCFELLFRCSLFRWRAALLAFWRAKREAAATLALAAHLWRRWRRVSLCSCCCCCCCLGVGQACGDCLTIDAGQLGLAILGDEGEVEALDAVGILASPERALARILALVQLALYSISVARTLITHLAAALMRLGTSAAALLARSPHRCDLVFTHSQQSTRVESNSEK